VGTVARLTRRGHVEAHTAQHDKRAKCLSLTEFGRRTWRQIEADLRHERNRFLSALSSAEIAELERLLSKLYASLHSIPE
jgi:DNA-binding MarR family transcriptional regulator